MLFRSNSSTQQVKNLLEARGSQRAGIPPVRQPCEESCEDFGLTLLRLMPLRLISVACVCAIAYRDKRTDVAGQGRR